MSGSMPDAEVVTASGGTSDGSTPSRAAMVALRSLMVSTSLVSNGPLLDPPDVDVSAGPRAFSDDADGRVWKYGSAFGSFATGSILISDEPAGVPSFAVTMEPSALPASPGMWA